MSHAGSDEPTDARGGPVLRGPTWGGVGPARHRWAADPVEPEGWRRRHAVVATIAWLHVPVVFGVLLPRGGWVALGLTVLTAALALGAHLPRQVPWGPRLRAWSLTASLFVASLVFVHTSGGALPARLHFVVVVMLLSVYRDISVLAVAAAVIVLKNAWLSALPGQLEWGNWTWAGMQLTVVAVAAATWWANVAARTARERALERIGREFELILEAAGEGIYGLDLDGRVTFVNSAASRMVGWEPAELLGQDQHSVLHHSWPDHRPYSRDDCPVNRAITDGHVHRATGEVFWRRDGTSFPVEYIATPVRERGRIVGAVVTFDDVSERRQAMEYRRQLSEATAAQAAQRELVHELEEALRPAPPAVEGLELGAAYVAAEAGAPTGGDHYDWQVLPDGVLHVAVVDVVGKGVAASRDALAVTHTLRMLAVAGTDLRELVGRADELLMAQDPELAATVLVAHFHPAEGRLRVVTGGHPPALLVRANGSTRYLAEGGGVPIGWPGAGSGPVEEVALGRSDVAVLYTDGLIEANKDALAGLEALQVAGREVAGYPATHQARVLIDRLVGGGRRDDVVALVLRRRLAPLGAVAHRPLRPLEYRFSPNPAGVTLARHFLSDWLVHQPVPEGEHNDLLLVATELVANAVEAASGRPESVALVARVEDDSVVVEVADDGRTLVLEGGNGNGRNVPDIDAERGRGLFLVEALADEVVVQPTLEGKVVRAVKRAVVASGDGASVRRG